MIFKTEVQQITERFIRDALAQYKHTADAILSNPRLPEWYDILANELTKIEAQSLIDETPFDRVKQIQLWASQYVEHVLTKAVDDNAREAQRTALREV